MSNASIISRLENKFEEYLQGKVDKYTFGDYLMGSINALEAVDYNAIETAKDFQYKFEIAEFNDEDPEIESIEKVTANFKRWLQHLKQE